MSEIDVFADENEPVAEEWGKLYRIAPKPMGRPHYYAILKVSDDGHCELHDFFWFGLRGPKQGGYSLSEPADKEIWDAMKEVWEWLEEWGYVELIPIGPEDKEYFATTKLTGEDEVG